MKPVMMKTSLIVAALLAALPWNALAQSRTSGPGNSGGGATLCTIETVKGTSFVKSCQRQFEVVMRESRVRDFRKLDAFRLTVEPILNDLEKKLPDFAAELREALNKNWYIAPVKIPELGKKNDTVFEVGQVAMQNDRAVWIDKNWHDRRNIVERGSKYLHEMAMHIKLKSDYAKKNLHRFQEDEVSDEIRYRYTDYSISMDDLRDLVELLLDSKKHSAEALRDKIVNLGFGSFLTTSQKQEFEKNRKTILLDFQKACRAPDDGTEHAERLRELEQWFDSFQKQYQPPGVNRQLRDEKHPLESSLYNAYTTLRSSIQFGSEYLSSLFEPDFSDETGKTSIETRRPILAHSTNEVTDETSGKKTRYLMRRKPVNGMDPIENSCSFVDKLLARDFKIGTSKLISAPTTNEKNDTGVIKAR